MKKARYTHPTLYIIPIHNGIAILAGTQPSDPPEKDENLEGNWDLPLIDNEEEELY